MTVSYFKDHISNVLLVLGVIMLVMVGAVEIMGSDSDPLLPAFAALAIGMTAVLDRVGAYQQDGQQA